MKHLLTIFSVLAVTVILFSCKKDRDLLNADIYARWEKRSVIGWPKSSFFEPGNGHIIEFLKNGTVNTYEGGSITHTATFTIQKYKGDCSYQKNKPVLRFSDNDDVNPVTITNDTLSISSPPCGMDGGTTRYVRLK